MARYWIAIIYNMHLFLVGDLQFSPIFIWGQHLKVEFLKRYDHLTFQAPLMTLVIDTNCLTNALFKQGDKFLQKYNVSLLKYLRKIISNFLDTLHLYSWLLEISWISQGKNLVSPPIVKIGKLLFSYIK